MRTVALLGAPLLMLVAGSYAAATWWERLGDAPAGLRPLNTYPAVRVVLFAGNELHLTSGDNDSQRIMTH